MATAVSPLLTVPFRFVLLDTDESPAFVSTLFSRPAMVSSFTKLTLYPARRAVFPIPNTSHASPMFGAKLFLSLPYQGRPTDEPAKSRVALDISVAIGLLFCRT